MGERIQIGPEIEVTVLSARKGLVKLGLTAPQSMRIRRHELDDARPAGHDLASRCRGVPAATP